jgi:hypothetical protein
MSNTRITRKALLGGPLSLVVASHNANRTVIRPEPLFASCQVTIDYITWN